MPPSVGSQQPATPQQRLSTGRLRASALPRGGSRTAVARPWPQLQALAQASMPLNTTPTQIPSSGEGDSTGPYQAGACCFSLPWACQGPVITAQQPSQQATLLQPNSTATGAGHSTSPASGDAGDQQGTQTASAWLCVRQISPRSAAHVYLHQHPLDEATWLEEWPVLRMTVEEGISFTHINGPWHNFHIRYNAESPPMFSEDIKFPNKVEDASRRLSCHWGRVALLDVGLTRAAVLSLVDQPDEWVAAFPISIAPPPSQALEEAFQDLFGSDEGRLLTSQTIDGLEEYRTFGVKSAFGVDVAEFLIKSESSSRGQEEGALVAYRSMAGSTKYIWPIQQPIGDFEAQRKRMISIRQLLGWQVIGGCEIIETCYD